MKKEIADKWIEALRSGKFKQGKQRLCQIKGNEEKYCCLGVLCDILKVPFETRYVHYYGNLKCYNHEQVAGLPRAVLEETGISDSLGSFKRIDTFNSYSSLSDLNDRGKSFEEIANVIEENWEAL